MFIKILYILKIIPKLGYRNFLYMVWYRFSMKIGIRTKKFPQKKLPHGVFYRQINKTSNDYPNEWKNSLLDNAEDIMKGIFTWFSYHKFDVGKIPNWLFNPFNGSSVENNNIHWTTMSDFDLEIGDIKIVWELSRFDWMTDLARAYKVSGDVRYLNRLNELLNDWCEKNPLNTGVNWKCGQETSLRVIKMITTAMILDQYNNPLPELKKLVYDHLSRIYYNVNYAISQDNNHGTSEASALYIGSSWLMNAGENSTALKKWKNKGNKLLKGRIKRLIQEDGSFSQRSMTYHRVVLDTFTWVLVSQTRLKLPKWDDFYMRRLYKLGEWQYKMTFGRNGDAPNYGSNDGANIGNLNSLDYRDFRGSTQAFFCVMSKKKVYEISEVYESAYWYCGAEIFNYNTLSIDLPEYETLDNHVLIMRKNQTSIFIKLPDSKFRPIKDAFHLDLWQNGENILRGNGTYSYNAGEESDLFKSTGYHNTLKYRSHEQMPKLSRFLYAEWIDLNYSNILVEKDSLIWEGKYYDYKNCSHIRKIVFSTNEILITDLGSKEDFEVNYHIADSKYISRLKTQNKSKILSSFTSLYYLEKQEKPLLTVTNNKFTEVKITL